MLEQIKEELAENTYRLNNPEEIIAWNPDFMKYNTGFSEGFDACMNLELPISFAKWCERNCQPVFPNNNQWTINKNNSVKLETKELFNHFLNNVYGK